MSRALRVVAAATLALLAACSTPQGGRGEDERAAPGEEAISRIVRAHNARVDRIDSLWARVSARVRGLDARGERFEEQGEGHLQIDPPRSVSLSIGKLGETYFAYGADAERYWMIDLTNDDRRTALTGALDRVTRRKARAIGLSVHPSELTAVLGIEPLDPDAIDSARWVGAKGTLALTTASRWGSIEYGFDTRRGVPTWVRILDDGAETIARAELSAYTPMRSRLGLDEDVRVPGTVAITTPRDADGYLRLGISSPTIKPINGVVFDFERLSRLYRVDEVIDLDEDVDWSAPPAEPLRAAPER